ncbi:MAG: phosphotransferase [Woeseiaceae bacterium]
MAYRYRKFGNFLVPLEQSISDVVRIFLFGYARHRLDSLGLSRSAARKIVIVAFINRFRRPNTSLQVTLSVVAHLGMQVHRGYKLFDFDRSEVTKVFNAEVSAQSTDHEISASRTASKVSSAPRFLGADPDARWFTEEYIRGVRATTLVTAGASDYQRFYADAERCLLDLAGCRPATKISLRSHVDTKADSPFRERWTKGGASSEEVDHVDGYIAKLRAWLLANAEADVLQLVLTHGDFSLVNAIAADGGLRFIDWESIAPGGVYSDIYNFVLVESYYERTTPDFVAEAQAILERYKLALSDAHPALAAASEIKLRFARRLYYLERMRFLLDREVTANLRQVTSKSIALFRRFDAELGDSPI